MGPPGTSPFAVKTAPTRAAIPVGVVSTAKRTLRSEHRNTPALPHRPPTPRSTSSYASRPKPARRR
ncbi:MAG TPA: hypothetical protein DCO74_09380, partial [Pseudomonas sp.]|nr:hypothetical protein [Pseudomonas sp.]